MSEQKLNPDALEFACAGFYNVPMGLTMWERLCTADPALAEKYRAGMKVAVSAYLAVAQPEVNSVEELDQLPAGSAITTFAHGRCTIVVMKVTDNQWASTGQRSVWTTEDVHAGLKGQTATVLHRPEVKP